MIALHPHSAYDIYNVLPKIDLCPLREQEPRGQESTGVPKPLSAGLRRPSRHCGGGFAEPVAGNVEKGEAPTLLREYLKVRLDENLDSLFARKNLDTNGRVAKVDLVPSSIGSSNDGVGHRSLFVSDRRKY
jgi:hypothetical protein